MFFLGADNRDRAVLGAGGVIGMLPQAVADGVGSNGSGFEGRYPYSSWRAHYTMDRVSPGRWQRCGRPPYATCLLHGLDRWMSGAS
jgi:hypothetical protein